MRKNSKTTVRVYIQDDVSEAELTAVQSLADTICSIISEGCDRTNALPLILIPQPSGEPLECGEGWELIYDFGKETRNAKIFALYVSLIGPVCGVIYNENGVESAVQNRWVEPLLPQGFGFRGESDTFSPKYLEKFWDSKSKQ